MNHFIKLLVIQKKNIMIVVKKIRFSLFIKMIEVDLEKELMNIITTQYVIIASSMNLDVEAKVEFINGIQLEVLLSKLEKEDSD
jgi:hypothetical protein